MPGQRTRHARGNDHRSWPRRPPAGAGDRRLQRRSADVLHEPSLGNFAGHIDIARMEDDARGVNVTAPGAEAASACRAAMRAVRMLDRRRAQVGGAHGFLRAGQEAHHEINICRRNISKNLVYPFFMMPRHLAK